MSATIAAFAAATTFADAFALAEQVVRERAHNDYPLDFADDQQEIAFYRNAARLSGLQVGEQLIGCAAQPW